jgi:hypothetical protein
MPLIDQVTQPTRRSRATPRQILQAFLTRIQQLPDYRDGAAVISDQPVPTVMPQGKFGVTVSMGGGNFNRSLFSGASHEQMTTEATIRIGVFQLNARERIGRANSPLLDDRSVLDRFGELMACLFVATPGSAEHSQQWEPVHVAGPKKGAPLLRSLPVPESFSEPSEVAGHAGWLGMILNISIEFDWDLYDR